MEYDAFLSISNIVEGVLAMAAFGSITTAITVWQRQRETIRQTNELNLRMNLLEDTMAEFQEDVTAIRETMDHIGKHFVDSASQAHLDVLEGRVKRIETNLRNLPIRH